MLNLLFLNLLFLMAQPSASLQLRSLSDAQTQKITLDSAPPQVFVVFQKNCDACRKQVSDLDCLSDTTKVFLLGMFSTEDDLRTEYRRFGSSSPGFYGDTEAKKRLGIQQRLTPQIIIRGKSSKVALQGYRPCEAIAKMITKL